MGSSHIKYIVRGAKMKCEFGSHTRKINLPLCHGSYIKGKPMMNEEDSVEEKNVPYFGICTNPSNPCNTTITLVSEEDGSPITGKKCEPKFLGKWLEAKEDALVEGKKALTTKSKLICIHKGEIGFISDGQEEEIKEGSADALAEQKNGGDSKAGEEYKVGLSPVGVSEEEIERKADEIVNEMMIDILLEKDGYTYNHSLYKQSVLAGLMSNLEVESNRYELAKMIPTLKRCLTSKNLGDFALGEIPDMTTVVSTKLEEKHEKDFVVIYYQIANLGDYNYLLNDKVARKKFIKQLDLNFDIYAKNDFHIYEEANNNAILKSSVLRKIYEVKKINQNYEESRQYYQERKKSIRKEVEPEIMKLRKKRYEEDQQKLEKYLEKEYNIYLKPPNI